MDPSPADIEVSIVMPCLNEAGTVAQCVRQAAQTLAAAGVAGEVVVADNGSSDGSAEAAAGAGARVIPVGERGYGAALSGGIGAARGRYVVLGDADGTYDFAQALDLVAPLRDGCDLVVGDRFQGGIQPGAMPWKNRRLGNPLLSAIGRLLFGSPVRDFHAGLRALTRQAFDRMELRTTGMEFAAEMIVRAALLGMKTCQVPISLRRAPHRRSHLRPWRDGWRELTLMAALAWGEFICHRGPGPRRRSEDSAAPRGNRS